MKKVQFRVIQFSYRSNFRSGYTWNRNDFLSTIYPIESTEDEKLNGSESDFYENFLNILDILLIWRYNYKNTSSIV